MRFAGFTLAALLIGVTVAAAQPPVPGAPPTPPPLPAVGAADAKLDEHLLGWHQRMDKLQNFRFVLSLQRTDVTFKQTKPYSGVVLCMKPNYAVLRLNYDADKTGTDYEAYICDGKAVYGYNGLAKKITEYPLPDPRTNPAGATDNLMLDFLTGLKAKDAKERFEISVHKEDANYVYLDVKPKLAKDKSEFQQLRMALYGPNVKDPKVAYLPALVYLVKPNGDTEMWKFSDHQTNIPNLEPKNFAFQNVPGWTLDKYKPAAAPQPPGRPGQPILPAGGGLPAGPGSVRPNK
jgi:TIGR03009 family protein